ncbi:complement component 1 Q subcomponent-binding protein, mitochondrial [Angomonas deanei]|uniref:Mitochondrial glycoprotein, putative n=1 Tax=Angomonas deanei TaxID=59799 RepID=S9WMY6_9TRYP|nr:complement component 1 Q subcomponent-binding protein, mitochondrial [Angomonas deanei]EPY40551.1 complement component 1 Q subcomponent-binding protein, mitochondrial [Angomonas deanei]CAD2214284.1 Mitochondrial glycoprotein, putative [Angomonas deanei]|eukprot:EPY38412.1 complement component 1 Q subcomponent-binding protein, mitochondrial [Angomonas deanei]
MFPVLRAQKRFAHDANLSDAVRRELEEEQSRGGKPEQPAIPAGWTVTRKPGNRTFQMTKQYEDEEIRVDYNSDEKVTDTNFHEISVLIIRNGKVIQADLTVEEGELVLDNICFYPDSKLALDESAEGDAKRSDLYPGPHVAELDDNLVDAFVKYFEKRGINQEFGDFITLYSFWAEQQEYESWLSQINEFVS